MRKKIKHNLGIALSAQRIAPKKPGFYENVYEIVRQIPKGKVTTYGAIAEVIGMKGSSRLVGQALKSVPPESEIPAQRVINRAGLLTAAHHFGGYDRLRWILEREGVVFKGEGVDMEKCFWKPGKVERRV